MGEVTYLISNNFTTIVLFVILFMLGLLLIKNRRGNKHYHLPPGPFSLPVLGTLPFLGADVREPLRRLTKDYGDIFTVYFGSQRVIILNSYEAIKEAFVKKGNAFSGRPKDLFLMKDQEQVRGKQNRYIDRYIGY